MANLHIFHNLEQQQHKFNQFFKHHAKLRALKNFDETVERKNHKWIVLLQECMKEGFLEEKEAAFLDHLVSKCSINFLDWNCKTKWVKSQIQKSKYKNSNPTPKNLDLFTWNTPAHEVYVPIHLLNTSKTPSQARAN